MKRNAGVDVYSRGVGYENEKSTLIKKKKAASVPIVHGDRGCLTALIKNHHLILY
jgi:hypothetical protein